MARVFATVEQYEAYTGTTAPANAARLLARASRLVSAATKAAIYDTDASGYPSDSDVLAASPWTSISAGGLSFSRQSAPVATVDDTELTPEAAEILAELGLEQVVWT
jgi:hypothetical protein